MVKNLCEEAENQIAEILMECRGNTCPNLFKQRNVNLFSLDMGFSAVDMLYVYMKLEDMYGISMKDIDWSNDEVYTFDGIHKLVKQTLNEGRNSN